ncbi:hypothetical protein [Agromyces sp. NPDC056965]|uniref:hypothetical protein n=1 Tax=Agromyces sp. NPDC056965 TaxID=3345983 RepID=UPI0036328FF5
MAADDFEFLYGEWHVRNRKLRDTTDPDCTEWVEFDATAEVHPVLDGIGHIDRMLVPDAPDGGGFEGFTLRLYEPAADLWRIWWSSTRFPGVLDTPVEGRFTDGHGVFEADFELRGAPARERFEWITSDPEHPRWQQSFSLDGGATWQPPNWHMHLTRRTAEA